MTLQQVKDELEEFYIHQNMLHTDCVQNSLMLVWRWRLKPRLVFLTGHCIVACPKRNIVIDPTVGCMWVTSFFNKAFFIKLLKGKKPDECLSWYSEGKYQRWWDYSFKYEKNKHRFETREEWDVDLQIDITSLTPLTKNYRDIGKFSDYMR